MQHIENHISDTAFLVNESRARQASISLDQYAQHWVPPENRDRVKNLWADFSESVYPYDDITLAVRNRFFLEHLNYFTSQHQDTIFINLGAGLTSYPFLLETPIPCLEIDLPSVINFKEARIQTLQQAGTLPNRRISFLSADLNDSADRINIEIALKNFIKSQPSFILLEGVSYYLNRNNFIALIEMLARIQSPNSIVAFDFWRPNLKIHPIFKKLQKFFVDRFDYSSQEYNLFDEDLIKSTHDYKIVEISNMAEQEKKYASTRLLSEYHLALPENYLVLQRDRK